MVRAAAAALAAAAPAVALTTSAPPPPGLCAAATGGVQCVGDDIRDAGVVNSTLDCCHACKATDGCNAWTWNAKLNRHCWVKRACADRRTGDDRYTSGEAAEPPAPTPPPPAPAPPPASFCASEGWGQVWADEFAGDTWDKSSWGVQHGHGTGGGNHCRYAACTDDNVYTENGALVIRTQRQPVDGYNYTSASLATKDKHSWQGRTRVCVRAKLPGGGGGGKGQGFNAAHWMMPQSDACWPSNGEIDMMEMINGDGEVHATYHWNSVGCGSKDAGSNGKETNAGADWATAWHEYAVEYDGKGYVAFAFDGTIYSNATNGQYYDVPYFVILDTSVGSSWAGPAGPNTVFPAYHRIDYVRVAQPE